MVTFVTWSSSRIEFLVKKVFYNDISDTVLSKMVIFPEMREGNVHSSAVSEKMAIIDKTESILNPSLSPRSHHTAVWPPLPTLLMEGGECVLFHGVSANILTHRLSMSSPCLIENNLKLTTSSYSRPPVATEWDLYSL